MERNHKKDRILLKVSGLFILLIKSSVNGQAMKKYVESPQNT